MYLLLENEKHPEKDLDFSSHCYSYYFSASKDSRPYFRFQEVFFGREREREREREGVKGRGGGGDLLIRFDTLVTALRN